MIQVFKPLLRVEEIMPEIEKALKSGWIGLGPKVSEFEERIVQFISGRTNPDLYCCALNSCTSALHLAVKFLNLPEKSMIITTPITFVSTNHAILYENHIPVFCDVEPKTGNINVDSISKAIKEYKISAIMVVHIGGYPCEMEKINEIAKNADIPIIEDCAHAFGSCYDPWTYVGNSNNICCFSFHAVKNLPVGDGGAIVSKNKELINWCKKQRWLGIDKDTISRSKDGYSWEYEVENMGYKYHMSDIAAIIGIEQLKLLDEDNVWRSYIVSLYNFYMSEFIGRPAYCRNKQSSYHFYPMFFKNRDEVYKRYVENGVYCGMHYKMNTNYKPYKNFPKMDLSGAKEYESTELTLPLHLGLTEKDVKFIADIMIL
jgi:perosamine synthetase